jgi:hypothetical protein
VQPSIPYLAAVPLIWRNGLPLSSGPGWASACFRIASAWPISLAAARSLGGFSSASSEITFRYSGKITRASAFSRLWREPPIVPGGACLIRVSLSSATFWQIGAARLMNWALVSGPEAVADSPPSPPPQAGEEGHQQGAEQKGCGQLAIAAHGEDLIKLLHVINRRGEAQPGVTPRAE